MGLLDRFRKQRLPEPEPEPVACVAIILDGNGRWAMSRGLPVAEGHREGTRAVRRTVEAAIDLALMEIFAETIERELPDLAKQGVRVRFLGRRDRAPEVLQDRMAELEASTGANDRLALWIAFDYGGRAELADAARRLVTARVPADEIDEDTFARALYEPELPDPDLLIRTGGDRRISNFLLWQLAYAELVFVDKPWPDFTVDDLRAALAEYAGRERRFGGR